MTLWSCGVCLVVCGIFFGMYMYGQSCGHVCVCVCVCVYVYVHMRVCESPVCMCVCDHKYIRRLLGIGPWLIG